MFNKLAEEIKYFITDILELRMIIAILLGTIIVLMMIADPPVEDDSGPQKIYSINNTHDVYYFTYRNHSCYIIMHNGDEGLDISCD